MTRKINIICTSKPGDGLLMYSYEHQRCLNLLGIATNLVIITHPNFTQQDYEYITKLSEILDNERKGLEQELIHFSDDPEFELGNLKISINNLRTSEKELVICE